MATKRERTKGYRDLVNTYYDTVTTGYRNVWGLDHFHMHFWRAGEDRQKALERTHDYYIRAMNLPKDAHVGDFGCGIGAFSMVLAKRFAEVTALNINAKQLAIARKLAAKQGITNITFVQQDIMALEMENAFDATVIYDVDAHLPDKREALRRLSRALRPGGKIIVSAWLQPDKVGFVADKLLIEPFNDAWAFPYLECDKNYRKYFKELGLTIVQDENWTPKVERCIKQGYIDVITAAREMSVTDIARQFDLSLVKYTGSLREKARRGMEMVLYSIALYDAGMFLYHFYVVQKKA